MFKRKYFGILLIVLAVIQTYLWIFEVIGVNSEAGQFAYCVVIFLELIAGLMAASVIKPI